jgi:hypothetical protein
MPNINKIQAVSQTQELLRTQSMSHDLSVKRDPVMTLGEAARLWVTKRTKSDTSSVTPRCVTPVNEFLLLQPKKRFGEPLQRFVHVSLADLTTMDPPTPTSTPTPTPTPPLTPHSTRYSLPVSHAFVAWPTPEEFEKIKTRSGGLDWSECYDDE